MIETERPGAGKLAPITGRPSMEPIGFNIETRYADCPDDNFTRYALTLEEVCADFPRIPWLREVLSDETFQRIEWVFDVTSTTIVRAYR